MGDFAGPRWDACAVWAVATSVWTIVASAWAAQVPFGLLQYLREVFQSLLGIYMRYVDYFSLHIGLAGAAYRSSVSMGDLSSAMWAIVDTALATQP